MRLVSLTLDYPLVAFDCGDEDLNKFLLDSLSLSYSPTIAYTLLSRRVRLR